VDEAVAARSEAQAAKDYAQVGVPGLSGVLLHPPSRPRRPAHTDTAPPGGALVAAIAPCVRAGPINRGS
jgi:hypothetical protein